MAADWQLLVFYWFCGLSVTRSLNDNLSGTLSWLFHSVYANCKKLCINVKIYMNYILSLEFLLIPFVL